MSKGVSKPVVLTQNPLLATLKPLKTFQVLDSCKHFKLYPPARFSQSCKMRSSLTSFFLLVTVAHQNNYVTDGVTFVFKSKEKDTQFSSRRGVRGHQALRTKHLFQRTATHHDFFLKYCKYNPTFIFLILKNTLNE